MFSSKHIYSPTSSSFLQFLMHILIFILLPFALWIPSPCSSAASDTIPEGSSLSVEKSTDTLVSSNGDFSAGFFQVGDNAFCFSIWFAKSKQPTLVWMANRDEPVNGKASKLTLLRNGNLVLNDAGGVTIWTTTTFSSREVQLKLSNNGNLVLRTLQGNTVLWQSFDSPTDTLLTGQPLTENARLVSSRSTTNFSSGFYKLSFDNDNVLRLVFKGPNASSVYWPGTWETSADAGRSTYNMSKIAVVDPVGHFKSSDKFETYSSDYGVRRYRRFVLDPDGNLRLYSFNEENNTWEVSWQAISQPCVVHGLCGANSMCTYDPFGDRTCNCLPGFTIKDPNDWTQGCEPQFTKPSCNHTEFGFLRLQNMEFYGYDLKLVRVSNLTECEDICLESCDDCKGIQFNTNDYNTYDCYVKTILLNGRGFLSFQGDIYVKLHKSTLLSTKDPLKLHVPLRCSPGLSKSLYRIYEYPKGSVLLNFLLWFACGIGALEITCIFLVWLFLFRSSKGNDKGERQQLLSATGFQRFSYSELKKATNGFSNEIGRGAGGTVYRGTLHDNRMAAIKQLTSEANQGEAEFLAEISTIGMLNHMNLIDMWGYCVEGNHRLLVYEYMEHGSLAENLYYNCLDWNKRFNIARGTAKGLAYLHEECLEWVLHCDVKPQNILLDSEFNPKVADFGLSKLLKRDERANSGFSRIRGTRGYMAPEWVYNLRITSKVDVYSYGVVVLEMITGRSPIGFDGPEIIEGNIDQRRLVSWVKEKISGAPTSRFWMEEIADPNMEGQYDPAMFEVLVKVALQCVEDDKGQRPSMGQVVEMLQIPE